MNEEKLVREVSVFLKIMDRGFHLSVPAEQEKYFRNGYEHFQRSVKKYKDRSHDEIEAIALTAIDCLVALQKNLDVVEDQRKVMETSLDEWSAKLDNVLLRE